MEISLMDKTWFPISTGIVPERIPGAMQVVLDILTDDWQNSGVLSKLARVQIVEFGNRLIRIYTKFEGKMGEAPQFGPMNRVMEDRSMEAFDFVPRGAGIFFSKEALAREPQRFIGYARHIIACVEELKTQTLLSIALQVENTRLTMLSSTPSQYLKMVHSTMGLNLRTPEDTDVLLSRLAGVLGTEYFSAVYTSGMHIRFFGHPNGPYVTQENAKRNYQLRTNLRHRETVPEFVLFPRFGTTIGQRAMMVFDHRTQSMEKILLEAKMAAAISAARAKAGNFLAKAKTWGDVEGFKGNPRVQRNYGAAKLVAANLVDSQDFATFLSNARMFFNESAAVGGDLMNYMQTVVLSTNSIKLTEITMQAAIRGLNLFKKAVAAMLTQSPNNKFLRSIGTEGVVTLIPMDNVDEIMNNVLVKAVNDSSVTGLHDLAILVGRSDRVSDYVSLLDAKVDLPLDFICLRKKLTYDYDYALMTADASMPEPPITLGLVRPIVAVGATPSNMTDTMTYKTGTGGMASPDAHKYMAVLVGAVMVGYGKIGGDANTDLQIIPIPAGSSVPDILPLNKDANDWLGQGAGNKHFYDFIEGEFSHGAKHKLQMLLSSHAVRSAALYCIGDNLEINSNPDAPYPYIKPVIDYAIANRI